jgi:hypothetical protein
LLIITIFIDESMPMVLQKVAENLFLSFRPLGFAEPKRFPKEIGPGIQSRQSVIIYLDPGFRRGDEMELTATFYETINVDEFVKSQNCDGFVKSSQARRGTPEK